MLGRLPRQIVALAAGLATVGAAGAAAAILAVPILASPESTSAKAATTVTVAATEFKFTLSKARVPVGRVTFRVTNKGKIAHDFKIAGKKTALLKPGTSQSITVTFKKSGRYLYSCTVLGHAAAGMKGVLAVGTAAAPSPTTATTRTSVTGTTIAAPPPGAIQIQVLANEFTLKLSQTSVPAGSTVFFTVVNQGQIAHDFVFPSLGKTTTLIQPGQTATVTVTFNSAGQIYYDCDLPQHAEAGMAGFFTVT
jgi:uncharacterized cupredoxin-like copper-binding protein